MGEGSFGSGRTRPMLARTRIDEPWIAKGSRRATRIRSATTSGGSPFATDEDRELVAADACQRVPFADAPAESLADRAQKLVAARVAEPVVDLFEIVEVDEDQHERADGDRLIEPLRRTAAGWAAPSASRGVPDVRVGSARRTGARSTAVANAWRSSAERATNTISTIAAQSSNARQPLSDVEMEAVQHRHADEPDVGQHELHPVDGFASHAW